MFECECGTAGAFMSEAAREKVILKSHIGHTFWTWLRTTRRTK